ncbi:hypothetical protein OV320_1748 [Actinobacteria bacterium OV320]|uniref:hypothetical protein n=1 Tax=Streptomyces sp. NBC_00723 TaxID=2903673 RepID=UPI0006BAAD8F|nr:hypothetical protein OV320_1748 [Actinobacteria bacterium OV320]
MRFGLTVAPDDAPAHRVEITQHINLVELPVCRPHGILVVQYPPDRPWRVSIARPEGTAALEADGAGKVVRRTAAR